MRGAVMICGTASDVGKSRIVAALCRLLARRGVSVAPFKAQNMSLNSTVTASGHEIARSQAHQAAAARTEATVEMNPVLLKPTGDRTSQLVVMGRVVGEVSFEHRWPSPASLGDAVLEALAARRARHEVVVLEGAGGAAEINLLERDLANLPLAARAGIPALIVGDIERGGVFGAIYGSLAVLPEKLRAPIRGFVVNKMRGAPGLLGTGLAELERRCGLSCLGVLPYLDGPWTDEEDSLALAGLQSGGGRRAGAGWLDVAVVALPRLSNFTDFDPLLAEPSVSLRYVDRADGLGCPDLVVLPGSKATVADLAWLRRRGLDEAIAAARAGGSALLGICAGYQLLGTAIEDDIESRAGTVPGLGLLELRTKFSAEKTVRCVVGRTASGEEVSGFELHHGQPEPATSCRRFFELDGPGGAAGEDEGVADPERGIWATSLHGLFENDAFRRRFLDDIAERRGRGFSPSPTAFAAVREAAIDTFADAVEQRLDLDELWRIVEGAAETTAGDRALRRWARPVPTVGDTTSAAERRADPAGWRLDEAARRGLYEVIHARRDIRRFRPDRLDDPLVERLLAAAHAAPSVGHSQPWRFVLVESAETRQRAALIAERERQLQATGLAPGSGRLMLDLQLEGIREAPVGIVVCCDRRVPAAGVLGRASFTDADVWSCLCAIENLWLAARGEGLGVGWVTLFPPHELAELVGLPEGVAALGWLCLGWPDERPPGPGLERAGWSERLRLEDVVLRERWDDRPRPVSHLRAPSEHAVVSARDAADELLTPPGSLGVVDRVLDRLASLGIVAAEGGTLVLAAADHPVAAHGVSTYPQVVTREVLEATVAGESLGAAAAHAVGFEVVAVDAGVVGPAVAGCWDLRPLARRGDIVHSDALEASDVERLLEAGRMLGAGGSRPQIVALGEVGVANSTVAAAMAAALLGLHPGEAVGLGAGGDSPTIAKKRRVVAAVLERVGAPSNAGLAVDVVLARMGGPELVVLAGVVLGAASAGKAVVVDGYATAVAALCAVRLEPGVAAHLVAGQRSREQAQARVLTELGLEPLLDLRLRAGEGVGAMLACSLLKTALATRQRAGRVRP